MKTSSIFLRIASLLLLVSCQRQPVTLLQEDSFRRCVEGVRTTHTPLRSLRTNVTFYMHENGSRTLSMDAAVLVAAPDKLYIEIRALGFPNTIVSYVRGALTIYQARENKVFQKKNSDSLGDVFASSLAWKTWIGVFISDFHNVNWTEFYPRTCAIKRAQVASGETLEWGKPVDGVPSFTKISWNGGWLKWTYGKREPNFEIPEPWFSVELPANVRFLENPSLLR